MNKNCVPIAGVNVSVSSKYEILEEIRKYLVKFQIPNSKFQKKDTKPFLIFTPNPEIINYAQKDAKFREVVNSGQINIPDGIGVVWAVKKIYDKNIKRMSGVDLMTDLCKTASRMGLRIGLIGGKDGIALRALECLQKREPNLKGWATDGLVIRIMNYELGIMNNNEKLYLNKTDRTGESLNHSQTEIELDKIVERIKKEKTDILFVGLGFPKQEYLMDKLRSSLAENYKPIVMMAVGGSFDYISGSVPRAPKFLRDSGLEWLYRLIVQPWRASRRLQGLKFFWRVMFRS